MLLTVGNYNIFSNYYGTNCTDDNPIQDVITTDD